MPGSSHDLPVLVELRCPGCGRKSYNPADATVPHCPVCGSEQHVVETFRDRRRVSAPVKQDRRRPSEPDHPIPPGADPPHS